MDLIREQYMQQMNIKNTGKTTNRKPQTVKNGYYNKLTYIAADLSIVVLIASFLQKGCHFLRKAFGAVRRVCLDAEHVELNQRPVDRVEHLHLRTLGKREKMHEVRKIEGAYSVQYHFGKDRS